jgi:hypothetical protein
VQTFIKRCMESAGISYQAIYLCGSRAQDNNSQFSDWDIVVESSQVTNLIQIFTTFKTSPFHIRVMSTQVLNTLLNADQKDWLHTLSYGLLLEGDGVLKNIAQEHLVTELEILVEQIHSADSNYVLYALLQQIDSWSRRIDRVASVQAIYGELIKADGWQGFIQYLALIDLKEILNGKSLSDLTREERDQLVAFYFFKRQGGSRFVTQLPQQKISEFLTLLNSGNLTQAPSDIANKIFNILKAKCEFDFIPDQSQADLPIGLAFEMI